MAEREQTDADADIEFEFFEDLPTTERPVREGPPPPPKRGGRPPMRPRTPGGGTPLVRLGLLVGGAIVLAVLIILWVTSCRSDAAKGAYEDYMASVRAVASESAAIGQQLNDVITSRGSSLEDIDAKLDGLAKQQAQVVARAQELEPPGPLLAEQASLVEAMQLRESGLAGLKQAFAQVQLSSDPDQAGQTLAVQAARLVAGDVVYQDSFKGRAQEVMRQEGVSGVAVPDSNFLSSFDLVGQANLTEFVKRLQGTGGAGGGGGTASGLHGNSIEAVRVQPGGQLLSQTEETTIPASDQLAFQVSVKNSGDFQEVDVEVTLTIQFSEASGGPIRKSQTIDLINQGQTTTVTFTDFANIAFGEPTTLKVSVKPVPGEENTSNNAVEYPVIFTLQ
jgi:hypothetical protein